MSQAVLLTSPWSFRASMKRTPWNLRGKAQKAFADAGLRGEVVVADNGSTDGSIDIAETLGARVIPVRSAVYYGSKRAFARRWRIHRYG